MQPSERNTEQQNIYETPLNPLGADTEPRQAEEELTETFNPAEPTPDSFPLDAPEDRGGLDPNGQLEQIRAEIDQLTAQEPSQRPEEAGEGEPVQPSDKPPAP